MKSQSQLITELQTKMTMLLHPMNHQKQLSSIACLAGITEEISFQELLEEKWYNNYWNFGMGNHERIGWGLKG